MTSRMDTLTRETAARLLAEFRQAQMQSRVLDAVLMDASGWTHPKTQELQERCEALEACIEALLTSRAGPRA